MKAESEVLTLRSTIEKALESDASAQEIGEMVTALSELEMTIELLRSTKVGLTIAAVRKKFPDSQVGNLARDMIAKWKELVPSKTSSSTNNSSSSSNSSNNNAVSTATVSKLTTISASTSTMSASATLTTGGGGESGSAQSCSDPRYESLPAHRKKIVDLLSEKLKMSTTDSDIIVAEFMACTIESGIHNMFNSDTDKTGYATKARSLMFNLKSNETLRRNIIDGTLDAELVVHLTPQQLASEEKMKETEKAREDAVAERRGDWVKIARDQIMRDNGLDPNKGGEFTCKKCKGTKTSHYAMQTRSADEPMTVFVCCLGCGNRWRTQ